MIDAGVLLVMLLAQNFEQRGFIENQHRCLSADRAE